MADEHERLAVEITALPRHDQLRLAGELLRHGKVKLAYSITDRVSQELGALLLLNPGIEDG